MICLYRYLHSHWVNERLWPQITIKINLVANTERFGKQLETRSVRGFFQLEVT